MSVWTLLRVLAGLFVGGFIYSVIDRKDRKVHAGIGCSVIVIGCGALAYFLLCDIGFTRWDFAKVVIFAIVFVFTIITGNEFNISKCVKKLLIYGGKLSYTIFLSHFMIVRFFCIKGSFLITLDWKIFSLIYLIAVLLLSAAIDYIIKIILKTNNV